MTTVRRAIATAVLAAAALTGTTGLAAGPATAATTSTSLRTAPLTAAPVVLGSSNSARKLDKRCRTGRVICVDKDENRLWWVVDGKIKLEMAARFGSSRTPTHSGSYRIVWKDIDHVSSLFGSAMPFALFFNGGQAVHYSADFAARGQNGASHGCVNTKNYTRMKELFKAARVGDKVVVYRS